MPKTLKSDLFVRCGQTITEPGALLFSPPDNHNRTYKHHICSKCYREIIEQFIFYKERGNTKIDKQAKKTQKNLNTASKSTNSSRCSL